jgi:hypothetical protein
MMIVTGNSNEDYTKILCDIFNALTFNLFERNSKQLKIDNISAYYGNQAFSIILNIFICLEIILILKNPISQMKSRLNPYFLISTFT